MAQALENPDRETEEEIQTEYAIKAAEMRAEEAERLSKEDAIARIYRQMGRIEGGEFFKKFIDVTTLHFYNQVKEEKLYRKLPTIVTWEAFCKQVVGCSREKLDKDLKNLKDFGPELYEMSGQLNLGYRDLSQLRKLPEGDRQQLIDKLEKKELNKDEVLGYLKDAFEESFKARREKDNLEELRELEKKEHDKQAGQLTIERNEARKLLGDKTNPVVCKERLAQINEYLFAAAALLEQIDWAIVKDPNYYKTRLEMLKAARATQDAVEFTVGRLAEIDYEDGTTRDED